MQLVKQLTLSKTEYGKEKVTEIRLLKESSDKYHVIVYSGEKGGRLRERSLTPFGELLEKAEERYNDTIAQSERKGYTQDREEAILENDDESEEVEESSSIKAPVFELHPRTKAKIEAVRTRLEYLSLIHI